MSMNGFLLEGAAEELSGQERRGDEARTARAKGDLSEHIRLTLSRGW